MARKSTAMEKTDNLDEHYIYRCTKCGKEASDPNGKFYKSQWSDSYKYNNGYAHLCVDCVKEMFISYEKKYNTEMATVLMCHKLDIPFDYTLYNSVIKNNSIFNFGLYMRQKNCRQLQYKCFDQTLLTGELNKTKEDIRDSLESKWTSVEIKNKNTAISLVGYDPFENYSEADRKFLFNELVKFFDDDIEDDPYKLSQIIQIVNNNVQIRNLDLLISTLNPLSDSKDIKDLNGIKNNLVTSNDKIAKENRISVKNREEKNAGKSSFTYKMRDLREKNFDKAEADYYNQLRGDGTFWAIEMSNKAILQNGLFDENDKKEIYETSYKLAQNLQMQLDDEKEKNRLLNVEIDKLKEQIKSISSGGDIDG